MENTHFKVTYTRKIPVPALVKKTLSLIKKYPRILKLPMFAFYRTIKELPENAKVLDVWCGDGIVLRIIQELRPDIQLFGIDVSDKTWFLPEWVTFEIMSWGEMTFAAETFDCVICFHVIEHILDAQVFIDEFERVLKKWWKVIVETPHANTVFFPDELNFFHDPTHYRPFTVACLGKLFRVNGNFTTDLLKWYRYMKLPRYLFLLLFPVLIRKTWLRKYRLNIFYVNHVVYIWTKNQ